MKKKLIALVIGVVACVCALAGCGATEKTFEKAGMRITLTSAFYEQEHIAQTATYVSSSAIVVWKLCVVVSFYPTGERTDFAWV